MRPIRGPGCSSSASRKRSCSLVKTKGRTPRPSWRSVNRILREGRETVEPNVDQINKILIVGSGAMGSQIGMVCALAGYDVIVQDVDEGMLRKAQEQLESRMKRNVEKSRIEQDEVDAAFSRMTFTTDLEDAASGADYVIEAVV